MNYYRKNLKNKNKREYTQGGFLQIIIVIVVALFAMKFFGITFSEVFDWFSSFLRWFIYFFRDILK